MMNRIALFLGIAVLLVMGGCSKDQVSTKPDAVNQALIGVIFSIGDISKAHADMSFSPTGKLTLRSLSDTLPTQPIDFEMPGQAGGLVKVAGSIFSVINDKGMSSTLNLTEAFQDYGLVVDGKTYTSNGSISYNGATSILNTGEMSAQFVVGGSLTTTGEGYKMTTPMALTISESMKNSSVVISVSGNIGGETVNYTQTMDMK